MSGQEILPPAPQPAAAGSGTLVRLYSSMVFGAVVLGALYLGGGAFVLLLAAGAATAMYEWGRMILSAQPHSRWLLPLLAAAMAGSVALSGLVDNPASVLWLLFALGLLTAGSGAVPDGTALRRLFFGILYIGFSMEVMIWLRLSSTHGLYNMLTLLLIVWASDISAYFSGRAIGGPKLAPVISPKKTWAGFFGSSLGAALVAGLLACPWIVLRFGLETIGHWSWQGYALMGFVLAMFGQAGDLFISIFKRHYGIKDSGAIMPGHGGILDRIDALLLVALLFGMLAMLCK